MTGLPVEYFRFGLFSLIGLIVSFVAEGLGLAIGATFSITVSGNIIIFNMIYAITCNLHAIVTNTNCSHLSDYRKPFMSTTEFCFFFLFILSFSFTTQNGSVVGPLLIAPLLGLGIYGFDFANDISLIMYAIMKLSFVRVGVVSLVLSVFGYDRAQLECPDVYCHFDDPKVLLRFLRIEKVVLWHEVGYLLFYVILFRMVLYLTLKRRILSWSCGSVLTFDGRRFELFRSYAEHINLHSHNHLLITLTHTIPIHTKKHCLSESNCCLMPIFV